MDFEVDLRLVSAEFHDSTIEVDDQEHVSGVLDLRGDVDDDWREAFSAGSPADAPWRLEDSTVQFGPIPIEEFAARVRALRDQIKTANQSVEVRRHELAVAERIALERRDRARQLALDALAGMFGRRMTDRET